MTSAILINLDYERYSSEVCARLWCLIEQRMEKSGFTKHKRLFISSAERHEAIRTARKAVAVAEGMLAAEGLCVFDAVHEFYWFEYTHINDLRSPTSEGLEVDYLDPITFFTALETPQAA